MSFAADLQKLCERAKGQVEDVVRKVALDLDKEMVARAPVDTGRLRSNMQVGLGEINTDTSRKAGDDPIPPAEATLAKWRPGQAIYITNSLPYARVAEYGLWGKPPGSANGPKTVGGFSKRAVGGFVRLAKQNVQRSLRNAARALK
jgi:hypothetical protein